MMLFAIVTQSLPFLPLALAIYISFNVMHATDMTLDGSFVTGAGVFAKALTLGINPYSAALLALISGMLIGALVASIQRRQKIDPLLAGVLATFMLSSVNLILMQVPTISLLNQTTLVSTAFAISEAKGYALIALMVLTLLAIAMALLLSPFGLRLRAFGDNPALFQRYGFATESYRALGFAFTNGLAAAAGCLTAQTVGYADINMGLGMTLTGLGAIIAGQQLVLHSLKRRYLRVGLEFLACLLGVLLYFTLTNTLVALGIDLLYLKIILGLVLIFFLRTADVLRTP